MYVYVRKEYTRVIHIEKNGNIIEISIPIRDDFDILISESDNCKESVIYEIVCDYITDLLESENVFISDDEFNNFVSIVYQKHLDIL